MKKKWKQLKLNLWEQRLIDACGQAVYVEWYDAHSADEWASIENAKVNVDEGCLVQTVGYVLEVGKTYVLLASNVHPPHCFGRVHIPLGWIEYVKALDSAIPLSIEEA